MARADTIALAQELGKFGDSTSLGDYYDEIVRELGLFEILVDALPIGIDVELAAYQMPVPVIRTLELISTLYGTLNRVDRVTLRSVHGTGWTHRVGTPVAFTQEEQSDNAFRLFPIPDQGDQLTALVTGTRIDLPYWLELPVALEMIFREYSRESSHQDIEFARVAGQLAVILFALVDVEFGAGRDREN